MNGIGIVEVSRSDHPRVPHVRSWWSRHIAAQKSPSLTVPEDWISTVVSPVMVAVSKTIGFVNSRSIGCPGTVRRCHSLKGVGPIGIGGLAPCRVIELPCAITQAEGGSNLKGGT
jgi:hypothetical protein